MKKVWTITLLVIMGLSSIAATPLFSTRVNESLKSMLNSDGKFTQIIPADNGCTVTGNVDVTGTVTAGNLTTTTSLSLQKHYAQLSSTVNQQPGTTSPVIVTFNQNDQIYGISHSVISNTGSITVTKKGVYVILAGAQVGKESGAATILADMWIRVNNVDVTNSNVRNSIKQADDTKVLINTSGIPLNSGDYVHIMQSVDITGAGAGILATSPVGEPVIPSIILTMYEM